MGKAKTKEYICDFCGSYWTKNGKSNVCAICGCGARIVMGSKNDYRRGKEFKKIWEKDHEKRVVHG